jgi:hypothetical protein
MRPDPLQGALGGRKAWGWYVLWAYPILRKSLLEGKMDRGTGFGLRM